MPLTDTTFRNAKPKEVLYKLFDGGGLHLLVHPNGGRYWRMDYRSNGKRGTLALGVYPTVSLAEARAKRDKAKKQIAAGINPAAQRKLDRLASKLLQRTHFGQLRRSGWLSGP